MIRSVWCPVHRDRTVEWKGRCVCCLASQLDVAMRQNEALRKALAGREKAFSHLKTSKREASERTRGYRDEDDGEEP